MTEIKIPSGYGIHKTAFFWFSPVTRNHKIDRLINRPRRGSNLVVDVFTERTKTPLDFVTTKKV